MLRHLRAKHEKDTSSGSGPTTSNQGIRLLISHSFICFQFLY